MRIAQIVCTFLPYKGGIGNSVYNLAERLGQRGVKTTIFTPNYRNLAPEYNDTFKVRRLEPVAQFGNAACLPQLLWKLRGFDIIHLHLPFLGSTLPVLLFCLLHPKRKLVLTYHMDLVGNGFKKFIFNLYKIFCLPLILRRANKIFVSSFDYVEHSDIKNFYKKYKAKFYQLPFGINTDKFSPKEKNADLIEKFFIEKENVVFLFVGGLDSAHYFKGLEILLRAFKILRDKGMENFRLIVVGEGELKADYQNLAQSFNIGDNVIFAGSVNNAELPNYYNLSDVFVLSSIDKSEAFGLVLLEAAACAKPLIASNLAGVRTIVQEGEGGFLALPGDARDLSEKIKLLLLDSDLRKKMGEKNRALALQKYSRDEMVAEYLHCLGARLSPALDF